MAGWVWGRRGQTNGSVPVALLFRQGAVILKNMHTSFQTNGVMQKKAFSGGAWLQIWEPKTGHTRAEAPHIYPKTPTSRLGTVSPPSHISVLEDSQLKFLGGRTNAKSK